jgi:hypothetical protein
MWGYFSIIFWVVIAVIGMALYTNPSMIPVRMYEGFYTATGTPAAVGGPAHTAAMRPAPAVNTMLRNLEQLIGTTPGYAPDVRPEMPQDASADPVHVSNTGRQQPQDSDAGRIASRPQSVHAPPPSASAALAQGKAFQQTVPVRERIVEVPVPRTCPSPPATQCPTCPDMRDYIRKDSIPCWACKL